MKLQHLISIDAVVKHDLNLTRAAAALNTSQPALSMHIQLLEAELRLQIFVRQRNRFIELSPAGRSLLPVIARAVDAAEELRRAAKAFGEPRPDQLTVAASQTVARYTLPPIVARFSQGHPKVRLRVRHGTLPQIMEMVVSGEADLSLSTRPRHAIPDLAMFPCFKLGWSLLTPCDHALLDKADLSLADIAACPIITYDESFASHGVLLRAFSARGVVPNLVVTEADSDIMKQYVRSGVGVAVLKTGAFDPVADYGLSARSLDGLVPETPVEMALRRNAPLNKVALGFMQLLKPTLAASVRRRLAAPYR